MTFMNLAQVGDMAGVPDTLRRAMSTGNRALFEAASAVHASPVGDISSKNENGENVLHEMILVHTAAKSTGMELDLPTSDEQFPVELAERFERAIMLGADPFLLNNNGKAILAIAAQNGCLEDLLVAMSTTLPPEDINLVLHWRTDKERNIMSLMASTGGKGLTAIRKLEARKVCGVFPPKHSFTAPDKSLCDKVRADWGNELNDKQIVAVARFMDAANMTNKGRQEVLDGLQPALVTGFRPSFEAARGVYASGVGNINERNANNFTALHELALHQVPDHSWTDK